MWVEHSFGTENGVQHGPEGVEAHFLSLRDGRPLTISMRGNQVSMHASALQHVCVCVFVCVVRAPIATPVRGHSWSVVWHACCLISVGSRNVSAQAAGVKASHSMPLAS